MPRQTAQTILLRQLKHSRDYLSGEVLSRELGVSRTAVWKLISRLRAAGFAIDAVPSRGYRLLSAPEQLDAQIISDELEPTCRMGRRILFKTETGSTNADAFRLAEAGAEQGTVVIADHQTSGKGRLGRRWESPAGVNLYCSVVLRPDLLPYEAPQLTFLSAVAVARAIAMITGLQPCIKWPNDVLLHGRKVAGLLNEMSAETDRIGFVILGIGINVNMRAQQFPDDLRYPATSLMLESGLPVSRQALLICLLQELDHEYRRFESRGFAPVRAEWAHYCNAFGREVQVNQGTGILHGAFDGIDEDGALLVRCSDGRQERILSGDVTLL